MTDCPFKSDTRVINKQLYIQYLYFFPYICLVWWHTSADNLQDNLCLHATDLC